MVDWSFCANKTYKTDGNNSMEHIWHRIDMSDMDAQEVEPRCRGLELRVVKQSHGLRHATRMDE